MGHTNFMKMQRNLVRKESSKNTCLCFQMLRSTICCHRVEMLHATKRWNKYNIDTYVAVKSMTTNWFALPALRTKELTSSSVSGSCNSPPRRPWTILAVVDFLASFASGIPNTVLLHEFAPEGQTVGFVGEGDMQAKELLAIANPHTNIKIPRREDNRGIFIR